MKMAAPKSNCCLYWCWLILIIGIVQVHAALKGSFEDECDSSDDCLPKSFLVCTTKIGGDSTCRCPEHMLWIERVDECRIKANGACNSEPPPKTGQDEPYYIQQGHCMDGYKCVKPSTAEVGIRDEFCLKISETKKKNIVRPKPMGRGIILQKQKPTEATNDVKSRHDDHEEEPSGPEDSGPPTSGDKKSTGNSFISSSSITKLAMIQVLLAAASFMIKL